MAADLALHGPGLGLRQPLLGAVVSDPAARSIQCQQVARVDVDELGRLIQPQDPVAPAALQEVVSLRIVWR
jgi:hypothetical protein